jgi:anti-sigma factor RsiW
MSDFENIHPTTPERQFDLLVDGELSEADRRALLLQLEHEPDGWRRCALAFLEAQCWKAELGQIARSTAAEPPRAAPLPPAGPAARRPGPAGRLQKWRQYAATLLTISASFLIALAVGMGLRGNWPGGLAHSGAFVAPAVKELPLGNPEGAAGDWETVALPVKSSDGQAETLQVQALRRDTLDQNMLEQIPDAISPELQRAFELSGHRVLQQREIVPVEMKDGRRLVVPVDHVEIHYVGRPSL